MVSHPTSREAHGVQFADLGAGSHVVLLATSSEPSNEICAVPIETGLKHQSINGPVAARHAIRAGE